MIGYGENNLTNVCQNCDLRHGGCTHDVTDVFETGCQFFIPGKCFYCVFYQMGYEAEHHCLYGLFPSGCPNFKEGTGYEEYLDYFYFKEIESTPIISENKYGSVKKSDRRQRTKQFKERQKRKAESRKGWILSGPYFSPKKNRVVEANRGKMSSYYKRMSNKAARRFPLTDDNEESIKQSKGLYKRIFDFWWHLW